MGTFEMIVGLPLTSGAITIAGSECDIPESGKKKLYYIYCYKVYCKYVYVYYIYLYFCMVLYFKVNKCGINIKMIYVCTYIKSA